MKTSKTNNRRRKSARRAPLSSLHALGGRTDEQRRAERRGMALKLLAICGYVTPGKIKQAMRIARRFEGSSTDGDMP